MTLTSTLLQERKVITGIIHSAILDGMNETWARCSSSKHRPEEPDFIAGLTLISTEKICKKLKPVLRGHSIDYSIISVFCHQTPKVKHVSATKACEVGDILFVHIHTLSDKRQIRNALLYQAKVASDQSHQLKKDDFDQLKLYASWPAFNYSSPQSLKRSRCNAIDVHPKHHHSGAQYMLIDNRPSCCLESGLQNMPFTYPILSCMADEYLQAHNHLASELFDFLLLRSGKVFESYDNLGNQDGWSQLIWDLLRISLKKAFRRKNAGWANEPRTNGDTKALDGISFVEKFAPQSIAKDLLTPSKFEILSSPEVNDAANRNDRNVWNSKDDDNAISLILMETSEEEIGYRG